MADTVAERRAAAPRWHRFHYPVSVFLIAFGVAKIAELAAWSRLHRNAARLLGLGDGGVTALLLAGKAAELLLTAVVVLGLLRRRDVWLITALAGWLGEMVVLAVTAGVTGSLGRLAEHTAFVLLFTALLAVTYVAGVGVRTPRLRDAVPSGGRLGTQEMALVALGHWRRATAPPSPQPEVAPQQATQREDAPQDVTHPDAAGLAQAVPEPRPVSEEPPRAEVTREEPRPARNMPSDQVTRQDMPIRRRNPPDEPRSE